MADEFIDLLSRRSDLLAALRDEPRERYELVDAVDASKSTVYKGVSQLQAAGLVERSSRGLEPTLLGDVAYRRFADLAALDDVAEPLASLPRDVDLDPVALDGATFVTPDERAVDRHLVHVEEFLRDCRRLRGFTPAVAPRYLSLVRERVLDEGLAADLVFTDAIVEHLVAEHESAVRELLDAESVTVRRTDADVPFGLLLGGFDDGDRVALELHADDAPVGVVANDAPESVAWARAACERCERRATLVRPGDLERA